MAMDSGFADMYPGAHVEYSFNIQDVTFEPFTIPLSGPRVTEVRFTRLERDDRQENNCTMMLMLGPVASIDDADRLADAVQDQLLDTFSLMIGCRVGRTRRIGHNLVPRSGEGGQSHGIFPAMTSHFSGHSEPRHLTSDDINGLRGAFLRASSLQQTSLLRIFRHAVQIDDEVARFILLYLILDVITARGGRSNQGNIDALIRSIDPKVDQSPDPRNLNVMETCYTRLRNEMNHRDVDHDAARLEISQRIHDFTNIVRTGIRQEYSI
jgi:hypothetical protein